MTGLGPGLDSCNNTLVEEDSGFIKLGPRGLYTVLGPGILCPIYVCLAFLLALLWTYGLYWKSRVVDTDPTSRHYTALLQLIPVINISLTVPIFISPPIAPFVSLLQDGSSVLAMYVYIQFTTNLLGGTENIVRVCKSTHTLCPLGTPPLCCLQPCRKPRLTTKTFHLVLLPLRLLSVALAFNLLVNLYLVFSGFYPSTKMSLENIHNLLLIPFFFSTLYTYKVFVAVTAPLQPDTRAMTRGLLNFFMFVFCKTWEGIFTILEGKEFLPCLPGLSSHWVAVMLASMVQVVLLCLPALMLPRLYARDWDAVRNRSSLRDSLKTEREDKADETLEALTMQDYSN